MATIIEMEDKKVEHLSECAEKVMHYGKKMLECLEEIEEQHKYGNRKRMKMRQDEYEDYPRYR